MGRTDKNLEVGNEPHGLGWELRAGLIAEEGSKMQIRGCHGVGLMGTWAEVLLEAPELDFERSI